MRTTILLNTALALLLMTSGNSAKAQQPTLTLEQAITIALEKNPARKLAEADVASAAAGYRMAWAPLLPKVEFSENVSRSDDPVYVFGAKLRQQRFKTSDFDLGTLNRPTALDNFATGVSGRWMMFDSLATHFEMKRAALHEQSVAAAAARTEQDVVFDMIRTYHSVLIADRGVEVAQHAVDTARALVALSQSRVTSGVAVESDALSAQVNLAARQQDLIEAQGNRGTVWAEFEAALGVDLPSARTLLVPLGEHPFPLASLQEEVALALKNRPDLANLSLEAEAQQQAVRSAKSEFGPRVDAYGSWQTDRQSFAGAGGSNWTAGAELRVDLLPFEARTRLQQQKAALARSQALHQAAEGEVRVEVSRSYYDHQSARQMVEVARATRADAVESVRILGNRYKAGLVTLTEVLRAEDAQRQSETAYWQAVYRNAVSYAALRLATGDLDGDLNQDQMVNLP